MAQDIQILLTKEELFNQTDEMLLNYVWSQTESDRNRVDQLKEDLLMLAKDLYPDEEDIEAHLFGSRLTGLAKSDSDVDIYLDIGNTFDGSISEDFEEQVNRLERFEEAMLYDYQHEFNVILAVKSSRIPILKFEHLITGLHCDLSFRSGLSTRNAELVKFYLDWDPRVKYVVTGVKIFMEKHGLGDCYSFNSYAQTWLALFFLMQPGTEVIPSLVSLRLLATQTETHPATRWVVEHWNCSVPEVERYWQERWIRNRCQLSREELLMKFFTFYSTLPPLENEFVLTTYNGMITKKNRVFFRPRWPIQRFYLAYFNERGASQYKAMREKFENDINNRFYLQDPFHQLWNITKMSSAKVSQNNMTLFVEYCKMMALTLKYGLYF